MQPVNPTLLCAMIVPVHNDINHALMA